MDNAVSLSLHRSNFHFNQPFMSTSFFRIGLLACLCTTLFFSACSVTEELDEITVAAPEMISGANTYGSGVHLALGNPSSAVNNTYYYWNYLISKPQFALSYHSKRGTPNWVSWHLDPTWLGSASRSSSFTIDYDVPSAWSRITSDDYKYTGFDRGHNCPSADRTYSSSDNQATFKMSNIIPQAPDNNQGPWASLENYCRDLVDQGYELYVISGSYGTGGTGSNGYAKTIANGKVTVPNRTWKVIVVLPWGSNDVSRISTNTRVIAVDMPNAQGIRPYHWTTYKTTVDAIESRMGYNLLSNVPSSIQSVIESRID